MKTESKTVEQEQPETSAPAEQVAGVGELGQTPGQSDSVEEGANKLGRILSMKIPVIVKIAEKNMPISSILKLNLGSVITFEKDAYQNVDLMVNNSTIGLGQPVKIGENFGLRIIQINDIQDTIKSLGGGVGIG
ncbi:MAG: FliM/FliN family flagellar motor switch protein [Planctomycetes bacterium]|nr:FliM/FliN family flagellar motor switch protein [Planctomycetota bacterium]